MDDFGERLKKIELELLALKTSNLYTSIRNTVTAYSGRVSTGLYRIVYDLPQGEGVISSFYSDREQKTWGGIYPRTPQGNTQVVEINTTFGVNQGGQVVPVSYDMSFVVLSSAPVLSITRIS